MKRNLIIIGMCMLLATAVMGTQITTPWTFAPGQSISSSKFNDNFDVHRGGINDVTTDQIRDSTILGADIGQRTITQDNMGYHSVGSYAIDSGAINSDTMIAWGSMTDTMRASFIQDSSVTSAKIRNNTINYWDMNYTTTDTYLLRKMPVRVTCGSYTGNGAASYSFTVTNLTYVTSITIQSYASGDYGQCGFDMSWIFSGTGNTTSIVGNVVTVNNWGSFPLTSAVVFTYVAWGY